ncbi:hypothetical protein [Xanthomonas albilineans]|uniref:Uncharacterized protein n=1 Tax=Xanthomonas albilineans (strain GPE PC73 / CFBP 7063) TaxID=380358 RepID=D2UF27_XANAP|nr:hypothetical protein [Xanthomonas albilineans]CBA16888.1 hypothetical protein XALC_2408 [Xanthomonas albilineans GPE PC73]
MNEQFPETFKFKGFWPAFIIMSLFVSLWVFIAITVPMQGGGLGGIIFCLGVAALLSLIVWIFLVGKSDIVIDENSITRVFLGKRLQSMAWTDVERIVVFPMRAPGMSRAMTSYNIIPSASSGKVNFPRKIYFGDQKTDLTDLIKVMNFFIARHNITVEHKSDGRTTVTNSL